MSPATARARVPLGAYVRTLRRATGLVFLLELGLRRWLLVIPGFTLMALLMEHTTSFDYSRQAARDINVWDLLPVALSHRYWLLWGFAFGFSLLMGDGLHRARSQGWGALTLMRVQSRVHWWLARLVSIGLLALTYVALATAVCLLLGVLKLPLTLEPSAALLGSDGGEPLYPRWEGLSMPLFVVTVGAYTALGLWSIGSFLAGLYLFFPQPFVPSLTMLGWSILSLGSLGLQPTGGARWLDLSYFLTYTKHMGEGAVPAATFLGICAGVIGAVLGLGSWRLRRLDL